ncbi:MAG: hypothetical protein U9Q21_02520 [Candidatus Auribacterota bacterium]|nr:hypothetical protein [Candidatus Auribacterota bacterium]
MLKKAPEFYEEARRVARHCCHNYIIGWNRWGLPHTVCIDYIREQMLIAPAPPHNPGRNKILGGVFSKGAGFCRVEMVASQSKGCHNRSITLWTLPEYLPAIRKEQLKKLQEAQ